ncbi:carboxypeptidase-like regulatory domain-containing protein [Ferruginibacter sp.]
MTTKKIFILFTAALLLAVTSCRKNFSEEQYVATQDSIKPDIAVTINATITGFVSDENNAAIAGALVTAGDKSVTTDEYGYFRISNTAVGKTAGFVKMEKAGYFKAFKTFIAAENKESFVRAKMLAKIQAGTINGATGGTVTTTEAAKITLPANGVIVESSGAAYTGTVTVYARALDMTTTSDFQSATPGDGRGIDASGYLKLLNSYSTVAVELSGSNGEKLQLAANSKAALSLPIPAALLSKAPASIALWSFDETNGLWKEESKATKTGNNYEGTVPHFSFWDGAAGIALVNLKVQVLNTALQPLANVAVMVTYANMPWNAGYGKFAYTDANGNVSGAVPANANLTLDVVTPCAIAAYSQNFTTTNSNIDLGTVTGNLGQGMVTITGTATNCSGQPVTDGYVQTYDNGFYNRIYINNGNFNFTGLACINTAVSYVAIDNSTHQQNNPQSITLVTGVNNLGNISACGTSTIGTISYTITTVATGSSITKTFIEPVDTLGAFSFAPYTTLVKLSGVQNGSPSLTLQFDGGLTLGANHKVTDVWSEGFASGRGYAPVPLTVTITEYGNAGGFISGSFSGMMLDFVSNAIYNVNYSFRIKRYN